jgi:hypothetical protein
MNHITLKVKVAEDGSLVPYTKHRYGGIDATQIWMFEHLFPAGRCPELMREKLVDLAEAHGWAVEVVDPKKGPQYE